MDCHGGFDTKRVGGGEVPGLCDTALYHVCTVGNKYMAVQLPRYSEVSGWLPMTASTYRYLLRASLGMTRTFQRQKNAYLPTVCIKKFYNMGSQK